MFLSQPILMTVNLIILRYVVRICCVDFILCSTCIFVMKNSLLFSSVLLLSNLVLSYDLPSLPCTSILVC